MQQSELAGCIYPTKDQFEWIEKQYPNCEWVEVKGENKDAPNMYFAFKPFNAQIYYASIDAYNRTQEIGKRNMSMTTGHLINGVDAYMSSDSVRIFLDAYAQNLIDLTRVAFKKKPTFAE